CAGPRPAGRRLGARGAGSRPLQGGGVRGAAGLDRSRGRGRRPRAGAVVTERLDPVTLSVLASALAGVAEEMGAVLIRGAYSSNIKERRDCSAALFDARGRMVAQAEHIPVHLGAMPESVAAVMERDPRPGDVFALNDPYSGGTHLPDVTLVSPVDLDGEVIAYGERRTRDALRELPDGTTRAEGEVEGDGVVDEDLPLRVAVTVAGDAMTIDFEGTAPQTAGNVNCPLAVTRSACYFALRV